MTKQELFNEQRKLEHLKKCADFHMKAYILLKNKIKTQENSIMEKLTIE